jgi:hypothetical protein
MPLAWLEYIGKHDSPVFTNDLEAERDMLQVFEYGPIEVLDSNLLARLILFLVVLVKSCLDGVS